MTQIDLGALRLLARQLARGGAAEQEIARAHAFCAAALAAYWERFCPEGGPRAAPAACEFVDLAHEEREHARSLGLALTHSQPAVAAYLLGTFYTLLLPDALRAERGMYFTPPPLVDRLLALAEEAGIRWDAHSVLDPAAGGGAFVTPIALRVARAVAARGASARDVLAHVAAHVSGIELDPFSAWLAQGFTEAALWEFCRAAGERLPEIVRCGDALRTSRIAEGCFDLVVGNPPYGRVRLEPAVRRRFERSLYGHANLYGIFTDLAVRLARAGGVVALVTPASFLGGQYYMKLRALLRQEAPPLAIDFVADRAGVFDAVLQETVLVVLGRAGTVQAVRTHTVYPTALAESCAVVHAGDTPLPVAPEAPWLLPRTPEDLSFLRHAARAPHRLRDYGYTVSTGPLVWNRHKAQLSESAEAGCHPLIWAESVLATGEFRFSARRRNHAPYFRLHAGQDHLLTRRGVLLVQRTTAKEQARRLMAAVMEDAFVAEHRGVVVENHLNVISPIRPEPALSLRALAALLNSRTADQLFRCISGSVAVSAFELESLPLPAPEALTGLDALLAGGADADAGETYIAAAFQKRSLQEAA